MFKKIGKALTTFFMCYLLDDHSWTSKNQEGTQPTEKELEAGMDGFIEYSKMYCKRCGHESKLNF